MIVPKLLHVVVQPMFVLVDTDTHDVQPGPLVDPATVPAAQIDHLPAHLEATRAQIAERLGDSGPAVDEAV